MPEETSNSSLTLTQKPSSAKPSFFSGQIELRFSKRNLILALSLVGLFLLGAGIAQSGVLKYFSAEFQKGNIALVISDVKSQKLLEGVAVSVLSQTQKTNAEGVVRFADLPTGKQIFQLSLLGYQGTNQEITLKRGENETVFVKLEPIPPITRSIQGEIVDKIDGRVLSGLKVKLGNQEVSADKAGKFQFNQVTPGQYDLILSTKNYHSHKQTVNLGEKDLSLETIQLTPAGRILFVSNRDGNRAVYTANLDGSNLGKLWENQKDSDDYSLYLSEDKSIIVFYSNRDQQKDAYGNISGKLYFTPADSINIKKISDDLGVSNIEFFPNSQALIYTTSHYDNNVSRSLATLKKYEFNNQKLTKLIDNYDFEARETGAGRPNLYLSEVAVSPDSNWIVFYASTYTYTANGQPFRPSGIYILYQDGSGLRSLVERSSVYNLKFSEDGGSLIYDAYTNEGTKRFQYYIQSGKEKEIERKDSSVLSAVYGPDESFPAEVKSPDGTRIAFRDFRDGKTDLFVKDQDGKNERRLTNLGGVNRIFWVQNRYLVFSVQRESESAAYIVGLTEKAQPLKIADIHDGNSLAGVLPT